MDYHRRPFMLAEFKIEVTYQCDLNCIHCSSDARPSNSLQVSREDCLRILSEAAQMGAREVAFSGGEPLLWSPIKEAVEHAAKRGMSITIYTSGNADGFEVKARKLHAGGATRFIFSVFGSTRESHERVTRKSGSFQRTREAMRAALSVGLTTEIHFVPMADNYRELSDVAKLAQGLGASRVSVLRLVPQGRAALLRGRTLSRIQNLELRRQILALRKSGMDVRTGSPYNVLMVNEKPACLAGIDRLIIGPDLRVYPCDAFKRIGAAELVRNEEWSSLSAVSLPECWERSPYLEAVRAYLTTDFAAPCKACGVLEQCLSGCLAQKAIGSGDLGKRPDPDCLGFNFKG